MKLYQVGQRVTTPLGTGAILGFESFTLEGKQAPTKYEDNGQRAIVRLDNPDNWKPTALTPDPYMFRSDLADIDNT